MVENIQTPHVIASKNDISDTVLMPGDPLRAKFIADNYLSDVKCINSIRNMMAFSGKYNGKFVSIIPSGMGMPSMGIYSYELFNFFGVSNIVRIGSAGALSDKLQLMDLVIALGTCYNSNFAAQFGLNGVFSPICSYFLLKNALETAESLNLKVNIGNVLSSDVFYNDDNSSLIKWKNMGVMAVEMEAAALYMNAAKFNKNALCICTISDLIFADKACLPQERQNSFIDMIILALSLASKL